MDKSVKPLWRYVPEALAVVCASVFVMLLVNDVKAFVSNPVVGSSKSGVTVVESAPGCPATYPSPQELEWPTSAVWQDGQIVFADLLSDSLVTYAVDREGTSAVQEKFSGQLPQDLSVIRALPGGNGYLVEDEGGASRDGDKLYQLDRQMRIVSEIPVEGRRLSHGWVLDVIYDWQPALVDGNLGILAFGDFYRGQVWSSGLVLFGEDDSQPAKIFSRYDINSDVSFQSTQEMGYLSVIGETGYMLVLEGDPYIHVVDLGTQDETSVNEGLGKAAGRILQIPEDVRHRPVINESTFWPGQNAIGHQKTTALLEAVEQSHGVSKIFAFNDQLFLVGRLNSGAETRWVLNEITPGLSSDELTARRIDIPLSPLAGHLTLALGGDDGVVGFLERGRVETLGSDGWNAPYLRVGQVMSLPVDWFENLAAPHVQKKVSECSQRGS